ncbi:leucine-rich repeat extensin-like protein 5 [Panicum virgatum]|uniref:leucine-rich repeat extensin-like protein 5 n=1 Tax=Panicum virgatum TaxID=38727 RepID=UPI0019D5C6D4|nr:leucine-rich repeat extensin-like protein 5 [Panicum virgatum]
MSIRIAVVLAVAAAVMAAARPSEAASGTSDADALRFPGRPGGRARSPIFPGFPGARPSPPAPGFPGAPSARPAPPAPVPSTPVFQPPCPKAPPSGSGFPGLPGSVGGGSTPSSPMDCVTPLAGLMTCGTFLTGSESETPTPQSECCSGLGAFLNTSSAAGDGDRTLRCLCPVILGDVNKMLPKPVDPVRMMYLPIACGVVLPPQVLYICFTGGQQTPPLVGRIPDVWEKPSAALSP